MCIHIESCAYANARGHCGAIEKRNATRAHAPKKGYILISVGFTSNLSGKRKKRVNAFS